MPPGASAEQQQEGEQKVKFSLQCTARMIGGHVADKRCILQIGERNSSKSTGVDMQWNAFGGEGGYVGHMSAEQLLERAAPADPIKANQWMHDFLGTRIVVQNEAPGKNANNQIDATRFKACTSGGDLILFRVNYGEKQLLRPTFGIILNMNQIMVSKIARRAANSLTLCFFCVPEMH